MTEGRAGQQCQMAQGRGERKALSNLYLEQYLCTRTGFPVCRGDRAPPALLTLADLEGGTKAGDLCGGSLIPPNPRFTPAAARSLLLGRSA